MAVDVCGGSGCGGVVVQLLVHLYDGDGVDAGDGTRLGGLFQGALSGVEVVVLSTRRRRTERHSGNRSRQTERGGGSERESEGDNTTEARHRGERRRTSSAATSSATYELNEVRLGCVGGALEV